MELEERLNTNCLARFDSGVDILSHQVTHQVNPSSMTFMAREIVYLE